MSDERKRPIEREKYRRTARNFTDKNQSAEDAENQFEFTRSREEEREFGTGRNTGSEINSPPEEEESTSNFRSTEEPPRNSGGGGGKSFLLPLLAGVVAALVVPGAHLLCPGTDDLGGAD